MHVNPLEIIKLTPVMQRTLGRREVVIGLLDGPVATGHADLTTENIRDVSRIEVGLCTEERNLACIHGTFVAGILSARRDSSAPAICPGCTLQVYPIFSQPAQGNEDLPETTPDELARAITETIHHGARVINLSATLARSTYSAGTALQEALDLAMRRSVIIVAAAGNQSMIGSSVLTRHPGVIPVVACDAQGKIARYSNLGRSIGLRGLMAPGENITSLSADGGLRSFSGTSAAVPFVTGTVALLWSEFPSASAAAVIRAVTRNATQRRRSIVPPLLDAWAAYTAMRNIL